MTERVLVLQLDGTSLPNLACLRIAGHHRARGDEVVFRYSVGGAAAQRSLWDGERFECAGALILVRLDHERASYPVYDRIAALRGVDGLIEEVARERLRMTQNLTTHAPGLGTLGYGTDALQLLDPMPPGVRLTKNGAWTIVHRVVDGKLKETSCCCKAPGSTTEACRRAAGNRTRCRCYCHSTKIAPATRAR